MTTGSIAAILSTFVSRGSDGVHRWVFLGSFALHVSAVVVPVLIACVASAPIQHLSIVIAVTTALLLALQPDAAQACSFAAACAVVLFLNLKFEPRKVTVSLVALLACSILSLVRFDPLSPVRHVEGIFGVVAARGSAWALLATVTLLLLPSPFLFAWARRRETLPLGLGVYVVMVLIAPIWGTFPVPVMGYGVSPILGYYIALGFAAERRIQGHALL
jgi:cell division protein FtsW (lipid II flippase)